MISGPDRDRRISYTWSSQNSTESFALWRTSVSRIHDTLTPILTQGIHPYSHPYSRYTSLLPSLVKVYPLAPMLNQGINYPLFLFSLKVYNPLFRSSLKIFTLTPILIQGINYSLLPFLLKVYNIPYSHPYSRYKLFLTSILTQGL